MASSIANLVNKLPHELPNDLRLRILGNKEMLGKSQIWRSGQSPFQKLNFGNSSPKAYKNWYQTFLDLYSFPGFLYFVANILSRIVVWCCNIKWFWSYSQNYICKPFRSWYHRLSHFHFSYWIWEVQKEREKITTIWASQEKKAFTWNKKFFIVFEGLSLVKK